MSTIGPDIQNKMIPEISITMDEYKSGVTISELLVKGGLCKSKSEAKRLMKQGGLYVWGNQTWKRVISK